MQKNTPLYIVAGVVVLLVLGFIGYHYYGNPFAETAEVQELGVRYGANEPDMVSPEQPSYRTAETDLDQTTLNQYAETQGYYNTCACSDGRAEGNDNSCYKCSGVDSWGGVPDQISAGGTFPKTDSSSNGVGCFTCGSGYGGTWGDDCQWHCCQNGYGYFYDSMCHTQAPGNQDDTCTDTDGGKDYYTKGIADSTRNGRFTDFCDGTYEGDPAVKEYFCQECTGGGGDCVWSNRASRDGYDCSDGKLVKGQTCDGAVCPSPSSAPCGDYISPNPGCVGPCQAGTYCPSGQSCQSGTCVTTNECTSGTRECVTGSAYRVCASGQWGATLTCPANTPQCNNGICESGQQECTPGQTECVNEGSIKRCDDFGQWGPVDSCPSNVPVCTGGTCTVDPCQSKTCPNVCKNADTLSYAGYCSDATGECVYSDQNCQWGCEGNACVNEPDPCATETCGNGVCNTGCGETKVSCPIDCNPCVNEVCGNDNCNAACGEDSVTCVDDCGSDPCDAEVCGNTYCHPECEDAGSCYSDCGSDPCLGETCGNDVCNTACGETEANCAVDCEEEEEEDSGIWIVVSIFAGVIAVFGGAAWWIIKKG